VSKFEKRLNKLFEQPATLPQIKPTVQPGIRPVRTPRREPFRPPKPFIQPKPKNIDDEDLAASAGVETIPAPVRPGVQPGVKPSTPSRQPFRPPKPFVQPKPKNRDPNFDIYEAIGYKISIFEDYESEVQPSTKEFWSKLRQQKDAYPRFGKHPILGFHGEGLSKEGFESHSDVDFDPMQAQQMFMQLMRMESRHKQELVELAKKIVSEIYGIEAGEVQLDAELSNEVATPEPSNKELDELSPEELSHVNKRITLNTMTQGAAVHQMMSVHHMIDNEIRQINPRLLEMYTRFSKMAHKQYWLIDIAMMLGQMGSRVGSEEVSFDENGEPVVVARAVIFPILVQELSKGIMELLNIHGYSELPPDLQQVIIEYGDEVEDEPWLIQIGPPLWKKFLSVMPRGIPLGQIIMQFAMLEPDDVHRIIDLTIDNPDEAKLILADVIKKQDVDDIVDEYDDGYSDMPEEDYV
jgi:hypothetical protein